MLAERHWEQLGLDARASGRLRLVTYMAALGREDPARAR